MYSSTCGVPFPLETNPVIRPAARACLNIATAHSAGDQRLVVGADQDSRALPQRVLHQGFRRGLQRSRHCVWIAQRLRSHPVLAICAMQIAAQHAEAVSQRARIGVEERFLLDGIALHAADISPRHVERAALVVSEPCRLRVDHRGWDSSDRRRNSVPGCGQVFRTSPPRGRSHKRLHEG